MTFDRRLEPYLPRFTRSVALSLLAPTLAIAGCLNPGGAGVSGTSATEGTDTDATTSGTETIGESESDTTTEGGNASFDVRESVEQLHVTHATPGVGLRVRDGVGNEVQTGAADELGSLVFRQIPPGSGYTVETADGSEQSRALTVMSVEGSLPDPSFYESQQIGPGFNYLRTRDGTTLSVYVTLPGPPEMGPYPTIVNYSGYEPSRPGEPLDASIIPMPFTLEGLCNDLPILCDVPNHPSGIIGGLMGYATVGVNMRGTGCSGGAYDFFETLQILDGYDAIETIAAQPWVLNNRVAQVGLSYPGLSQLWVAQSRPPSLAAITPLSVFADTVTSTLAPGGMFNDGFALAWAENVLDGARPYGQGWEQGRVDAGDGECAENQLLHGQQVDTIEKAKMYPFYDPAVGDPLSPERFVGKIDVPVFTAGAWQDEQTGAQFPGLWDKFTGAPLARFNGYNGVHADGYTPDLLIEWNNFLSFYIRGEIPKIPDLVRTLAPLLFETYFGAQLPIPPDRFLDFASYDDALAAYEAEDAVRILFEAGGHPDTDPGLPKSSWQMTFPKWPVPGITPTRLYLQTKGRLSASEPPVGGGGSEFAFDLAESKTTTLPTGDVNLPLPPYQWEQEELGKAVVFVSDALTEDTVMVGWGSVDLWIRSTSDDAALEVTLSEVRPDGKETYVQSGWLLASHQGLAADATDLRPVHTHLEADAKPLVPGEWTQVRVELFPFAHAFRAGSIVRLAIDTPGGTRPEWTFILDDIEPDTVIAVGHDADYASSVLLPVLTGAKAETPLPPCPSLRGQPCRDYVEYSNEYIDMP